VAYVKPHGGLYNAIVRDEAQAKVVVDAVKAVDSSLVFLGLAGSVANRVAAEAGLKVAAEAFADRSYNPDGSLVARTEPNAVLHDPQAVAARVLRLVQTGQVEAIDGSLVDVDAQSICFHGDSQGSIDMARAARELLESSDVRIAAFAGAGR
ncbi:LamB/YcsF family protein, partial [Brevibacterium aurantiacum]